MKLILEGTFNPQFVKVLLIIVPLIATITVNIYYH